MKRILSILFLLFSVTAFACEYENNPIWFRVESCRIPYISRVNSIGCIDIGSGVGWGAGVIETNSPLRLTILCYEQKFYTPDSYTPIHKIGFMQGQYWQGDTPVHWGGGTDDLPLVMTFFYRVDNGAWKTAKRVTFVDAYQQTTAGNYILLDIDTSQEASVVDLVLFAGNETNVFRGLTGPGISSLDGILTLPSSAFHEMQEVIGGSTVDDLNNQLRAASFYSHVQLKISKHKRPLWK